ncbi:hypothetical protein HKD37_02G004749 [Glycine soja]
MGEGEPNQPLRRTLQDYMANIGPRYFDALARPNVQTTNVEIRASLIHLIHQNKFHALDHKDPYAHLTTFIRIYIFFEEFPTMGKPISPLDILLFKWTVVIFSIFFICLSFFDPNTLFSPTVLPPDLTMVSPMAMTVASPWRRDDEDNFCALRHPH